MTLFIDGFPTWPHSVLSVAPESIVEHLAVDWLSFISHTST